MVVKDVQYVLTQRRYELEILSFPERLVRNSATYHIVMDTLQSIAVPNEDVVDISPAGPKLRSFTVLVKLVQNGFHNLLFSQSVIAGYVKNLADAKCIHILLSTDGAYELG